MKVEAIVNKDQLRTVELTISTTMRIAQWEAVSEAIDASGKAGEAYEFNRSIKDAINRQMDNFEVQKINS